MKVHEEKIIDEAGNRTRIKSLIKDNLHPDSIGTKKGGNIICRWGYFYRRGITVEKYVSQIENLLNVFRVNFNIVDSGDHWSAFRGGASVANQSHWYVEIEILSVLPLLLISKPKHPPEVSTA